jgi:hypothetical protein
VTRACRLVAGKIGLVQGTDYEHVCLGNDFAVLLHNLANINISGAPPCDIGASSITETLKRKETGMGFSKPTYQSALRILVYADVVASNPWAFLRPLRTEVWLAILGTLLTIPSLVFFFEYVMSGRCEPYDAHLN